MSNVRSGRPALRSMTHTDIYHTLIRNGFKERLDKKGVPTGALVFPHRPVGIKLLGMVDYLKKHRASLKVGQTCPVDATQR